MTLGDATPTVEPAPGRPGRRRTAWVAAAGLGVVAVVGGGVWAWQFWAAQGPQPAEALPADTLAYVAVDLDPPGGQKAAAFDALRKFPSLRKELGVDSSDDLRRSLVDEIASEGGCDLDFDLVDSWAGDRAALAVVAQEEPELVAVVQVADPEEVEDGLAAVTAECGEDEFGHALDGGWAVLARDDAVARKVVDSAARGSLDGDDDYRRLTGAAGDPGVVTLYAAPGAGAALLEAAEKDPFLAFAVAGGVSPAIDPVGALMGWLTVVPLLSPTAEHAFGAEDIGIEDDPGSTYERTPAEKRLDKRFERFDELTPAEQDELIADMEELYAGMAEEQGLPRPDGEIAPADPEEGWEGPELPADLRSAIEGFSGLGGIARFDDGTLELEVVGDRMLGSYGGVYAGDTAHDAVASLPADTAVAFGAGLADSWPDRLLSQLRSQWFLFGQTEKELVSSLEESTGLSFPEDFEALGGDALAVVARSGFDPTRVVAHPAEVPVAVLVTGDADRIEGALEKVRAAVGRSGSAYLHSERTDEGLAIGPDADYLQEVATADDTLDGSDRFQRAVPDADGATTVTFVDFDAGDWLANLLESDRERRSTGPLDTVGLTVTEDDDEQHVLLRLTLD